MLLIFSKGLIVWKWVVKINSITLNKYVEDLCEISLSFVMGAC